MRESDFFIQEKKVTQGTVREGLDYALARPDLYVVMLVVFFVATFGLNMQIFNALMATKEFGKGPASYGLLGTYVAIGSLTGALNFCAARKISQNSICYKRRSRLLSGNHLACDCTDLHLVLTLVTDLRV
jgi:hypothetical protein